MCVYCSKTFPTTPGHPMPCAAVLMAVMDSHTPSGVFEVMKMARLQKMISTISTNPDGHRFFPVKSCFCSMKKMGNPWEIHGKNMGNPWEIHEHVPFFWDRYKSFLSISGPHNLWWWGNPAKPHQATENGKEECLDAGAFLLGAWFINSMFFAEKTNDSRTLV